MLRVVGAGLPRTGTHTLKLALARLAGGPSYHMTEVFDNPDHVAFWRAALDGEAPDWCRFFHGYTSAVDWPSSAFWPELAAAFPASVILLSTRADGAEWWRSADATIMEGLRWEGEPAPWRTLLGDLWRRTLCAGWEDPAANAVAYERWVEEVRRTAPPDRLVEWRAREGWGPLCEALGVPVPEEPFPHVNSTVEWEERRRQREAATAQPDEREEGQ
ncbi:MAG: hypothetical protein QOI06_2144 [Nocardioidaceae bacterium]|jgi:hypothetical protein|nr:hypothetical protein [Nocardioidaceae bacterium]